MGKWAHPPVNSMTGNLGGHGLPDRTAVSIPQFASGLSSTSSKCMMLIYLESLSLFHGSSVEPDPTMRAKRGEASNLLPVGDVTRVVRAILVGCCHHSIP